MVSHASGRCKARKVFIPLRLRCSKAKNHTGQVDPLDRYYHENKRFGFVWPVEEKEQLA